MNIRCRDALKRLSTYQPREEAWKLLESELENELRPKEENRDQLQASIGRLTRYRAPQALWNRIEQRLNTPVRPLRRALSIAAAVAGLMIIGVGTWLILGDQTAQLPATPVSEKKAEVSVELQDVERASYGEELKRVHEAIEACLTTYDRVQAKSYEKTLTKLEKLSSDSLHLEKAKGLQAEICDQ